MNKKLGLFAFFLISGAALMAQTSSDLRYIYDEAEQLIGVIDENNNATAYRYDAVGNLVAIERLTARGPVDLFFVEPNRGRAAVPPQPGTPVTIHGIGFSATPAHAQNQVTFNGIAAVVDAATTTMIKTSVPAGATTGPVRVTSPSGMAASRSGFIVTNIIVTVSPSRVTLATGQSQPFTATLTEAGMRIDGEVIWSVNGIVGGNPTVGTIDANGLYLGPTSLPNPPTVTVTATSAEEPAARAAAAVMLGIGIGPIFAPGGSYYRAGRSTQPMLLAPVFAPGSSYITLLITGLNPNRLARGATNIPFTATGKHLQGARALDFLLPGGARDSNITVANVTANADGTQVTGRISVNGAAALGARTVVAQTPVGPSTRVATGGNQMVIE